MRHRLPRPGRKRSSLPTGVALRVVLRHHPSLPHPAGRECGNVAVLVDVHVVLPLGAPEEDTSWFTAEHVEEVTVLVQDAVEQRVKQHAESLHSRGQAKHRKELAPASAFSATGTSVAPQQRPHHNPCAPGPLKGLK
ncbi:unnamed protein product [Merluccius merluccius]